MDNAAAKTAETGVTKFVKPSPNWKARHITWRVMPKTSATGTKSGISIGTLAGPDGINRLIAVVKRNIPEAVNASPNPR